MEVDMMQVCQICTIPDVWNGILTSTLASKIECRKGHVEERRDNRIIDSSSTWPDLKGLKQRSQGAPYGKLWLVATFGHKASYRYGVGIFPWWLTQARAQNQSAATPVSLKAWDVAKRSCEWHGSGCQSFYLAYTSIPQVYVIRWRDRSS